MKPVQFDVQDFFENPEEALRKAAFRAILEAYSSPDASLPCSPEDER